MSFWFANEKGDMVSRAWEAILELKWLEDCDFERVAEDLPDVCEKFNLTADELDDFCIAAVGILDKKVWEYVESNNVGEFHGGDVLNDWLWHIVGCGPGNFRHAMENPGEIVKEWRQGLAPESFSYVFNDDVEEE